MKTPEVRKAVVAGQFYSASAHELRKELDALMERGQSTISACACIMPHAGYVYSGKVAAKTISRVQVRKTAVLLGPNHTGYGAPVSILAHGAWETPLGTVPVNAALADRIVQSCDHFVEDFDAHSAEHSLEVELPFLQYCRPDIQIVPVVLAGNSLKVLRTAGIAIADAILACGMKDDCLIVASSDMTHYESQEDAQRKDNSALQAIFELNEEKLMQRVRELEISM